MRLNSLHAVTNNDAKNQHAERQLRRSERELANIFDNSLVALQWLGPEGQILRANQAQLDLLGYVREDYVGRNFVKSCQDEKGFRDLLGRLQAGETIRDHELRLRCRDG